jgi:hypothetical protein
MITGFESGVKPELALRSNRFQASAVDTADGVSFAMSGGGSASISA